MFHDCIAHADKGDYSLWGRSRRHPEYWRILALGAKDICQDIRNGLRRTKPTWSLLLLRPGEVPLLKQGGAVDRHFDIGGSE